MKTMSNISQTLKDKCCMTALEVSRISEFIGTESGFYRLTSKLQELMMDREDWHAAVHGAEKSDTTERLN